MSMSVLKPIYTKVGHTKYLNTPPNAWMGGRGTVRGPQYFKYGGTKYLNRGMGAGPTHYRDQGGVKRLMTAEQAGMLGYSTLFDTDINRLRYPGVQFRIRPGFQNMPLYKGQLMNPQIMPFDYRTPLDRRKFQLLGGPTIWSTRRA